MYQSEVKSFETLSIHKNVFLFGSFKNLDGESLKFNKSVIIVLIAYFSLLRLYKEMIEYIARVSIRNIYIIMTIVVIHKHSTEFSIITNMTHIFIYVLFFVQYEKSTKTQ